MINYPDEFGYKYNCVRVGIDLSKNCTGVCIIQGDKVLSYCNIIPQEPSKKRRKKLPMYSPSARLRIYNEINCESDKYSDIELHKSNIFTNIAKEIIKEIDFVMRLHRIDTKDLSIRIEGIILDVSGNSKWLLDNSQLAGIVKSMLILKHGLESIRIYAPTELKKKFTGIGGTQKELTIELFKHLNKNFIDGEKIDDIADAFALAYEYKDINDYDTIYKEFISDYIVKLKIEKQNNSNNTVVDLDKLIDKFMK